jgi:ABC-2 type transport system ATP-binding protein
MENLIKVEKLCKSFGSKKVLNDISFEVRPGEILGFVGPNGAGKTTTIKLILGLQSIDSGDVFINGYDIKREFAKGIEKVGAIVENPDAYMYLSGWDNLKLAANLYDGIGKKEIEEVVKIVGLENRIKDKVSKYSLGMRQRLGIAMALLHDPNVLILDEPTNGLDPEGIKELRDLIKKLAKDKKMGILISSHNLAELESFITDVCFIKNGFIIKNASIEEVKANGAKPSYVIELDKVDGVDKVLDNVTVRGNTITIQATKEEIPDVIKKLVKKDYKIYSVSMLMISLEDAFLNIAGGNKID